MKIHHAIIKKAEANKATFTFNKTDKTFTASKKRSPQHNYTHETAKVALNVCLLQHNIATAIPGVQIMDVNWQTFTTIKNDEGTIFDLIEFDKTNFKEKTIIEETLAMMEKKGLEPHREAKIVKVVPQKYKDAYRERGNPNHCGDWLAKHLEGLFDLWSVPKGGVKSTKTFDHEAFTDFLIENNVEMAGEWTMAPITKKRGWQGRYRMHGRGKLEIEAAKTGYIVWQGEKTQLPEDFRNALLDEHPKIDLDINNC